MATKQTSKVAKKPGPFPVSAVSPFGDKYDIQGEREALKDLIDSDNFDQITIDPRYPRYLELEKREEELRQSRANHQQRGGAQSEMDYRDATRLQNDLGKLTDDADDSMDLHTREGARLFMGRAVQPGQSGYPQTGGKKVGAALRAIWYLSGNDNPYADFALIDTGIKLMALIDHLNGLTQEREDSLNALKRRGLHFSVVHADPPVKVALGFRSPYGYSIVNLVSTYDYHVRVVKTLVRKDLMDDKAGYTALYNEARSCRRIFERVIWFQRYLMREELRTMSRSDWLPTADDLAKKRVQAAVEIFGELPREVFSGAVAPRHSRRRLDLSPSELRLLEEVPLAGAEPELEAAAAELV
jgi:integrating conjugative element protein (TIGR03761 family)